MGSSSRSSSTSSLIRPWLVLTILGGAVAGLSASGPQTAWIYFKRQDGTVEKKIATYIPAAANVQYAPTKFMSRDPSGRMENLVAWVPFIPIITLSPREFPRLPERAKQQLEQIGCRIPQLSPPEAGQPTLVNVIQGEFSRPGQKDWAVMCVIGTRVSIHVLWSKPSPCPSDFASSDSPEIFDTKVFVESLDMESILSGHVTSGDWVTVILPTDQAKLMGYPLPPPPMDHQAIESWYWGKAASQV